MASTTARIGDGGYQELNQSNLQNAIDSQFGTGKAIVTDNGDGTFTVSFIDSKRDYNITSNGIENGIDWNKAMSNAKAPDNQTTTSKSVIGIGTDGNPVDMDLWKYCFDEVTGGYALNSKEVLQNTEYNSNGTNTTTIRDSGYLKEITDNEKINIPAYISTDGGKTWTAVTSLYRTFMDNENISTSPQIPVTVVNMMCTFENCTQLKNIELTNNVKDISWCFSNTAISEIPNLGANVENMDGAFSGCQSLSHINVKIPEKVKSLRMTFYNCTHLKEANLICNDNIEDMSLTFAKCVSLEKIFNTFEIPSNVSTIQQMFFGCTNLKNIPDNFRIPFSVTNVNQAFSGCENLSGTILLDTTPTIIENCFQNTSSATESKLILNYTSNCSNVDSIISHSTGTAVQKGNLIDIK